MSSAGGAAGPGGNKPKIKHKTILCKWFETKGFCRNEDDCRFAHGEWELKEGTDLGKARESIGPSYKTRMCADWEKGHCPRNRACIFAHGEEELARYTGGKLLGMPLPPGEIVKDSSSAEAADAKPPGLVEPKKEEPPPNFTSKFDQAPPKPPVQVERNANGHLVGCVCLACTNPGAVVEAPAPTDSQKGKNKGSWIFDKGFGKGGGPWWITLMRGMKGKAAANGAGDAGKGGDGGWGDGGWGDSGCGKGGWGNGDGSFGKGWGPGPAMPGKGMGLDGGPAAGNYGPVRPVIDGTKNPNGHLKGCVCAECAKFSNGCQGPY
eukprot:TRINITY_DN65679_c0_g1_i1.p1 TRINITY_DN65679_c0_g1~~TRINITY_DN65679_c0_g1_i1.p1  ORF type:complete len:336 (-),score=40.88 TRINITY_DN65679_c0_g1_i1:21-983(-)